jgi:hypothetical protein
MNGELVDVHVARRHHAPGGGNADLRLLEIFGFESDGVQHGAARRAFGTIDDNRGKSAIGGLTILLRTS